MSGNSRSSTSRLQINGGFWCKNPRSSPHFSGIRLPFLTNTDIGDDDMKEMTKDFEKSFRSFSVFVHRRRKLLIEHLLFDWSGLDYDVFCFPALSTPSGYQLSSSQKHFHKLLLALCLVCCIGKLTHYLPRSFELFVFQKEKCNYDQHWNGRMIIYIFMFSCWAVAIIN